MISTMRERMDAKCGNSNDNAFRLRKLFLAHDANKTGLVHFEDLRQMCDSFGMQLDDDRCVCVCVCRCLAMFCCWLAARLVVAVLGWTHVANNRLTH